MLCIRARLLVGPLRPSKTWALASALFLKAPNVIRKVHHASTGQDCKAFHYTGRYARSMSSQALARPKKSATSKKRKKTSGLAGLVATTRRNRYHVRRGKDGGDPASDGR